MFESRPTTVRKTLVQMSKSKPATPKSLTPSTPNTTNETNTSEPKPPRKYTLVAMSKSRPATPKPVAPRTPTTTNETNIIEPKPAGKYTIGAMSKSKPASPKALGPNTANEDDFPALAPSAKKLDLTPRQPMAAMPLAGYRKADPRAQRAKPKDDLFSYQANPTGLPRCADPRCPIKGAHLAKRYATDSKDLPSAVESLVGRALSAAERGNSKGLEQSSKRLDLFFEIHARDHCEVERTIGEVDRSYGGGVVTFVADNCGEAYGESYDHESYDESCEKPYDESDEKPYDESFEGTYEQYS